MGSSAELFDDKSEEDAAKQALDGAIESHKQHELLSIAGKLATKLAVDLVSQRDTALSTGNIIINVREYASLTDSTSDGPLDAFSPTPNYEDTVNGILQAATAIHKAAETYS